MTFTIDISQETSDAEWGRRFEYLTKGHNQAHAATEVESIFGLLRSMLKMDPERRVSAEEALRHLWFSDIDESPVDAP